MIRWIKLTGIAALLIYFGAMLLLYTNQRSILFKNTHTQKGVAGFFMGNGDEKTWVELRNQGKEKALIYFPGNSEDYWENPDDIAKNIPNYTVYFPHYRGYGQSSGTPSQDALFKDALNLYAKVSKSHNTISVIGRSLGSGVAIWVASQKSVSKLILVTPYDSIVTLGQIKYPYFPIRLISKDSFDSFRYAPKINTPTLVLLAENDNVVPHISTQKLINSFKSVKPEIKMLKGSTHGTIIDHPDYFNIVSSFLHGKE